VDAINYVTVRGEPITAKPLGCSFTFSSWVTRVSSPILLKRAIGELKSRYVRVDRDLACVVRRKSLVVQRVVAGSRITTVDASAFNVSRLRIGAYRMITNRVIRVQYTLSDKAVDPGMLRKASDRGGSCDLYAAVLQCAAGGLPV